MSSKSSRETALRPSRKHPAYWEINDKTVLLLGGSVEDNLFQVENVESHLDALLQCGGNYVRCTMSSRDKGNIWPYFRDPETGLYDLERPEGAYWERFDAFVRLTRERGIVMQVEVFDRFDFARDPWRENPFNPRNNSNYDASDSGLQPTYEKHPGNRENPFFRTPPALEGNALLRRYQEIFLDRLLATTLPQPHVLYCISNETNESPEWGAYWAKFIRARADEAERPVQITEMWDDRDLESEQHRNTFEHPELYDFVDISQVNHQTGQDHWDQLMKFRDVIAETGKPRPINTVKIYGANSGYYGTTRDAQERFWRNIFAGLASTRFHRPPAGLGLSKIACANIRSARMLAGKIDLFSCSPDAALLLERSRNEAFTCGIPGAAHAVFFPDGGNLILEDTASGPGATARVHWLDIRESTWRDISDFTLDGQSRLRLRTPTEEGYWVAAVVING